MHYVMFILYSAVSYYFSLYHVRLYYNFGQAAEVALPTAQKCDIPEEEHEKHRQALQHLGRKRELGFKSMCKTDFPMSI